MIFITAKSRVLPEQADRWPEITAEFTQATRNEAGCLWFDWSRSVDDPNEYVLVEAFRDDEAGSAHVRSDHFKQAQETLPPHLASTADRQHHGATRTTGPGSASWPCPRSADGTPDRPIS